MHQRVRLTTVFLVALALLAGCTQGSNETVHPGTPTSTPRTGTISATNAVSPTAASRAASVAQVGNFSVAVMDIERNTDSAVVYFVITKVTSGATSGEQTPQKLQIALKDDHSNQYSGTLTADLSGAPPEVVSQAPLGFSYTDSITITIPEKAPIQTIRFGSGKELAFKDITFVKPTFRADFKEVVTPGSVVPIGKFLRVTPERMIPDLFTWASLITIENQDYNVTNGKIQVVAQYTDGTIKTSTPAGKAFSVSGLSKGSVQPTIPYPKAGVPYFMLLFFYSGEFAESGALTLWPVVESDFPPRVGQGLEQSVEHAFVNVYRKEMGNPINVPHWFSGNNAPEGDSDVLVQEFPTGAIVWGWHNGAGQPHALDGGIWNTYLTLGGPKGWLGPPIGPSTPDKGFLFFDFQGGYIATSVEIVNKASKYPSGRLAYDCGDAVCTVDLDIKGTVARAINKKRLVSGAYRPDATLSPDGTLIAYGYYPWNNFGGRRGGICDADGSHCVEQALEQPEWSWDGTRLAFIQTSWTGGGFSTTYYFRLQVMNNDGTDVRTIYTSTSGVMTDRSELYNPAWSPDGKNIAFQQGGKVYKVNLDGTDMQEVSPDMRETLKLGSSEYTLTDSEPWIRCVRRQSDDPRIYSSRYGCSTSPDGDWLAIAIIGSYSNQHRLYLVGPGSRVYSLELPGWERGVPSWSFSSATPPRSTATSLTTSVTIKVKRMQAGSGCTATDPGPVQSLDLEKEYLPVVVASENGAAGVPLEALKAQAVASRTFASYKMQYEPRSPSFDVCDTEADQVYNPSMVVRPEVQRAVEETRGIVAKWNGEVIAAFFVKGDEASGTARFVTVNEGKSGKDVTPTALGSPTNSHNRGAMGQDKANELAAQGWDYQRILRYFYGADLVLTP